MGLGFSGCPESWLFLGAMHRLKKRSLKVSLAAKPDSGSKSPIFLSFEAGCKALDNHCHFIVSLTNVLKSHCCQKEGQQYKIEPLTSCHWGNWSHFAFISVWADSGLEYSQKNLRNQSQGKINTCWLIKILVIEFWTGKTGHKKKKKRKSSIPLFSYLLRIHCCGFYVCFLLNSLCPRENSSFDVTVDLLVLLYIKFFPWRRFLSLQKRRGK